ncbi:MotE family protein [Chelativorans intermedius]|uniref:MotE family protein n=1 Tax=Chelativorans intermedius TaxID=515947 RepID=A0ABV6D8R5_9HYPH|nr:MotE family protein [Chelativorans intermedius]MCT8997783.1 MotE family protein [Chelativorans intermedius]
MVLYRKIATFPPRGGLALAALVLALSSVHAAETEGGRSDEVQRFCTNIADAARDRRYALQAQELERLRGEVDSRIAALEKKRAEYEGWLARRDAFLAKAEGNLVQIYSNMRPDAAAERLSEVRAELAAAILMKLDPRTAGVILNEMNSKNAATLTTIMASAARPEDPS